MKQDRLKNLTFFFLSIKQSKNSEKKKRNFKRTENVAVNIIHCVAEVDDYVPNCCATSVHTLFLLLLQISGHITEAQRQTNPFSNSSCLLLSQDASALGNLAKGIQAGIYFSFCVLFGICIVKTSTLKWLYDRNSTANNKEENSVPVWILFLQSHVSFMDRLGYSDPLSVLAPEINIILSFDVTIF